MEPKEQGTVRIGLASGHLFDIEGTVSSVIGELASSADGGFVELQRVGSGGPIWVRPEAVTEIQR